MSYFAIAGIGSLNMLKAKRSNALSQNNIVVSIQDQVTSTKLSAIASPAKALCSLPNEARGSTVCDADLGISYNLIFYIDSHTNLIINTTRRQGVTGLKQNFIREANNSIWIDLCKALAFKKCHLPNTS